MLAVPPVVFSVLGRMVLSLIRFSLARFVTLALRGGMLVIGERFPLGYFMGLGMGRRLMRLRGVLFLIGRHSLDGSGSRFRHRNIDEIQYQTGIHIDQ